MLKHENYTSEHIMNNNPMQAMVIELIIDLLTR